MASLADLPELVGYFSYSREDDEDSGRALSALRERIQSELRGQLGRPRTTFRLWQDRRAFAHGSLWEEEIKNAINQSVFFIPIITPTLVRNSYAKLEFDLFLAREAALGRNDLVFPILYIPVSALGDSTRWQHDPLLSVIAQRHGADFAAFRHLDVNSTEFSVAVERFCAAISAALNRPWSPLEERNLLRGSLDKLSDTEDQIFVRLKILATEFFRAAGRPIHDGAHDQLLGPDPIWISKTLNPLPEDITQFSDFLSLGNRGFLVYQGELLPPTSVFLDRLRVEGKFVVPINMNAIAAALTDSNAPILLADLERSYESDDNLFDTRNAIVDERFFFGRSDLLSQVGAALARGEHVLVSGLRKCGKTSFLNILRQHLSSHPVCFVDLQRYDRHDEDWPSTSSQRI